MMRSQGQLRLGGMGGVVGLDMGAALKMAKALRHDVSATAELLPMVENGMVTALNKRGEENGE